MIGINNKVKASVDTKYISQALKKISRVLKIKKIDISVVLVGELEMKKLNLDLRKINKPTDVLSLSYDFDGTHLDGEIIICYPLAKKQASLYHHTIKKELTILLTHAMLHLVGYDHQKKKDRHAMQKVEEQLGANLLQRTLC